MRLGLINLLIEDPVAFALVAIPLLYSVMLHEVAHGWVAYRYGDPTAKMLGRLTLNPLKHLDPIGTLMLLLVGFGWAKPVPVAFHRLRDRKTGMILVASAGIIVNTLLAFSALLISRIVSPSTSSLLALVLYFMAQINIILASFNLIPIPPLDGSKILMPFAPANVQQMLRRIEPYGFIIIIGLFYFGFLTPIIAIFRSIILAVIEVLLP